MQRLGAFLMLFFALCACNELRAASFDLPHKQARASLFAVDAEPDPKPDNEKTGNVGRFGFGLYTSPFFFTRFGVEPGAMLWAIGLETCGYFSPRFGLMANLSALWGFSFDTAPPALGGSPGPEAYGWEVSLQVIYRLYTWTRGAAYVHAGPTWAYHNAPYDGKATWSVGHESCLGVEFGKDTFRGFFEAGFTVYLAVNRNDVGWLHGTHEHATVGAHIMLLRAGLRFYF